jgi:CBS domain-containing protein
MQVSEIVRRKGREVYSIPETRTLAEAAQLLWQRQVGALVVKDRRGELAGIVSERDIVRAIAENGAEGLAQTVGAVMNPDVVTCEPQDRIERVMKLMTLHRVRHIPLRDGDRLVGMVSIGDLVKYRLEEKTYEADVLRELNIARIG